MQLNKLKGKMVEKSVDVSQIAEKAGVTVSTIYRHFNNEQMTIKEATVFAEELCLSPEEINDIFFN